MKQSIVNNSLLQLYMFTVIFEYYRPNFLEEFRSISFIIGIFYVLSSLSLNRLQLKDKNLRLIVILIAIYILLETVSSIFHIDQVTTINSIISLPVIFNLFLFILLVNHLTIDSTILNKTLLTFSLSTILMAILLTLNFGIATVEGGRIEFFGENPNSISNKALFGIVISSFLLHQPDTIKIFKLILIVGFLFQFQMLIFSASRAAYILLFAFFGLMFLLSSWKVYIKVILLVILISASPLIIEYSYANSISLAVRMQRMNEFGLLDGRDNLFLGGLIAFTNGFLFIGTGHSGFLSAMKEASGYEMDTHNVFITVLVKSGLFGFIAFVSAFYISGKMTYKSLKLSKMNYLPMILFIILVIIMMKSGGFIGNKILWTILSFIIAMSTLHNSMKSKHQYFKI